MLSVCRALSGLLTVSVSETSISVDSISYYLKQFLREPRTIEILSQASTFLVDGRPVSNDRRKFQASGADIP